MPFQELELQNRTAIETAINDVHTLWIAKLYDVDNSKRRFDRCTSVSCVFKSKF